MTSSAITRNTPFISTPSHESQDEEQPSLIFMILNHPLTITVGTVGVAILLGWGVNKVYEALSEVTIPIHEASKLTLRTVIDEETHKLFQKSRISNLYDHIQPSASPFDYSDEL